MRILIATTPEAGHVNPFTTLAQALLKAGHEVLWHTAHRFEAKITALGATFFPFEQAMDIEIAQFGSMFPERAGYKGLAQIKFDLKNIFIAGLRDQVVSLVSVYGLNPQDVVVLLPTPSS